MNRPSDFNLAKNVSIVLLMVIVTFVFSCNSGNTVASNFGKRKYTRGHFNDPVAKVKTNYSTGTPSAALSQPIISENNWVENPLPVKSSSLEKPDFGTPGSTNQVNLTPNKPAIPTTAKNNNPESKNNVSLNENSTTGYEHPYEHGDQNHIYRRGGSDQAGTYLTVWLVCLALAIICLLLFAAAASSIGSSGIGAGCLLLTLSGLGFILAIVFFILWIVAIAG